MTTRNRTPERGALTLATLGALGYVPKAPGTAGALASALFFLVLWRFLPPDSLLLGYAILLGVLLPVTVWTATAGVRQLGQPDPPPVVIDEFLGQQVALSPLVLQGVFEWKIWLAGFILFRAFDIVKPFPIRRLEHLPEGWGVMADDLLAGAYAAVVVAALSYVHSLLAIGR